MFSSLFYLPFQKLLFPGTAVGIAELLSIRQGDLLMLYRT